MPFRRFQILGIAVKVEFKQDLNAQKMQQTGEMEFINKRFEGMIQLDIQSNGDFSGFDEEKLKNLITAYFQANTKIVIPDIVRNAN